MLLRRLRSSIRIRMQSVFLLLLAISFASYTLAQTLMDLHKVEAQARAWAILIAETQRYRLERHLGQGIPLDLLVTQEVFSPNAPKPILRTTWLWVLGMDGKSLIKEGEYAKSTGAWAEAFKNAKIGPSPREGRFVTRGTIGFFSLSLNSPMTGQEIGLIVVGFRRRPAFLEIVKDIVPSGLVALLCLSLMGWLSSAIMARWVYKPTQAAFAAIRDIKDRLAEPLHKSPKVQVAHDLQPLSPSPGSTLGQDNNLMPNSLVFSEFNDIYKAFEGIYRDLERSRNQSLGYAQRLEATVAERTEEIIQVNEALRKRIEELTEMKAKEQALQHDLERARKLELVGNLASGVAHDLNNILSGFVNYPEIILMDLPKDSPLVKHVRAIQRSGEKAAAMVQDLMTLARRSVAVLTPVNASSFFHEFMLSPELAGLRRDYPKVRLDFEVADDLHNILSVPFHLTKIIMNLLCNAFEAIEGEGQVRLRAFNSHLGEEYRGFEIIPEGDYLRLDVSDSGVGIASTDIDKIFEPFYTKKVMGRRSGTGLGMSVIYSTVKDELGYIDVQSRQGQGTTMSVYYPPTKLEPRQNLMDLPLEAYRSRGERILVADDEALQRDLLKEMLNAMGYQATFCPSGEEAIDRYGKEGADLVLLDMVMDPGIDGLETYRRLREINPLVKVVIVSGYSESERILGTQELGAKAFLKKPYRMESLGTILREVLRQKP